METRRIRRLERRRTQRTVVVGAAIFALGIAGGMALPHSTPVSATLFALAACCLVMLATRRESVAPLHGLHHHVVRLSPGRSLSATMASFWSRIAGSTRALWSRTPAPTPLLPDDLDDDTGEWWVPSTAPAGASAAPSRLRHLRASGRLHLESLARRMSPTDDVDALRM